MYKVIVLFTLFAACFGFAIDPNVNSDIRIIGGQDAVEGQFPWMISLRMRSSAVNMCGGSIINSKRILTAAHCVYYDDPADLIVVAGSILLSSGGVTHNVSRHIMHENLDMLANKNDVAVIELAEELEFTEFIQPIELGTEFVEEVDSVLSGWGSTNGLYDPDILQYMNRRTITLEECREVPTYFPDLIVSDDEICTMSVLNEIGFCYGDSGSPLVADGKQIGIASWGNLPCARGAPDVFMRVSSYVNWITEAIST